MLKLVITDDEGRTTVVPLEGQELTIGRAEHSSIRLNERNVSRRHARLSRRPGGWEIEDLRSYNGTRIAGTKIERPEILKEGDPVRIGDFQIVVQPARAPVQVAPDVTASLPLTSEAETALIALPPDAQTAPTKLVPASGPPRLVVLGGGRGRELVLDREEVVIGQAPECDLRLEHASVSRAHAKVVHIGSVHRILDLQSTNGVRVNGRQVPYAELEPGDVIELGEIQVQFVVPGVPLRAAPTSKRRGARLAWSGAALALVVVAIGVGLLVAWPTAPPAQPPAPPLRSGGPASPLAASRASASDEAAALIAVARAQQRRGALAEAEEAARRARALLEAAAASTSVPDRILAELAADRGAREAVERARELARSDPAAALVSLDALPVGAEAGSSPAVTEVAAAAFGAMLDAARAKARTDGRAPARDEVLRILEHPRLRAPTLPEQLDTVRHSARSLAAELDDRERAAPSSSGRASARAIGGSSEPAEPGEPAEPPPQRPNRSAGEGALWGQVRSAAADDPARARSLACRFVREYPDSRFAPMARQLCH